MKPWYANHENLAALWRWLEDQGQAPENDVARFLDEPWHWDAEWQDFQLEKAAAA